MRNIDIKEKIGADTISKKNEVYTARKGYFYTMGKTSFDFVNRILNEFPNVKIIDSGDHYASFRGGASVANSSHWFVKFTLN